MDLQGIRDLCSLCHKQAEKHGWWDKERNDGELIALMHSELSEALEALRRPHVPDKHLPHLNPVGVELADVLMRIFDYCGARNIDLAECLKQKFNYNEDRLVKQEGKKF